MFPAVTAVAETLTVARVFVVELKVKLVLSVNVPPDPANVMRVTVNALSVMLVALTPAKVVVPATFSVPPT